jgi:regulator of protease activity HflC (stomatin/prohibitin superfamily)
MRKINIFTVGFFAVAVAAGIAAAQLWMKQAGPPVFFAVFLLSFTPRLIREYEQGILLRLGRFKRVLEPGINFVVPLVDSLESRVDMRIRSTPFNAEKTLTKDTVPVNVDAVLFWKVVDAKTAVLGVEEYLQTITWAAQTTLRDVIGRTELVRMISDREALDVELQKTIDHKVEDWGIAVVSVEIRDLIIPGALEDAMSRKAQADREKEARIILAESELKVAEQMKAAAETYHENPMAMQLRAMNMTYESIKERGALMVIPSSMTESFDPMAIAAAGFRATKTE